MKIADSIQFPFRTSQPWLRILLLGVCHMIPVVGPLVALGYGVIVEKELVRDINADPPPFEFANFMQYLERGVAPFVVRLIAAVVIVPVVWVAMFGTIIILAAGQGAAWSFITAAVLVVVMFATMLLLMLAIMPLALRASLLGKIGEAFDFRWTKDFIRRVGGRMVLSVFVLQFVSAGLMIAGMCLLVFGMYLTMAIAGMMSWHLQVQLYHLYLDRGGTPLNIPDEPMLPAFPVVPVPPSFPVTPNPPLGPQ